MDCRWGKHLPECVANDRRCKGHGCRDLVSTTGCVSGGCEADYCGYCGGLLGGICWCGLGFAYHDKSPLKRPEGRVTPPTKPEEPVNLPGGGAR